MNLKNLKNGIKKGRRSKAQLMQQSETIMWNSMRNHSKQIIRKYGDIIEMKKKRNRGKIKWNLEREKRGEKTITLGK